MNLRRNIIVVLLLIVPLCIKAQDIRISIFSNYSISSFVVTAFTGKYDILGDGQKLEELTSADVLHFALLGDSIIIKNLDIEFGYFRTIELVGHDSTVNNLKIIPAKPAITERIYNGDLLARELHGRILLINTVELELYVAGTVESEGGPKASSEYFKTQAVLCRTFALESWYRHEFEDFNLCDGVHCQAYKGRCFQNFDILESTYDTKGEVIVDSSLNLITAAFHSNSGGQTVNSEDVWVLAKPYLKSKTDNYWKKGRNAFWTKTIAVADWKKYLINNGVNIKPEDSAKSFAFSQPTRMNYYHYNEGKIPLKSIRQDWKLKSTFFSIIPQGDMLQIKGRGYGHGVGLSQEGAMQMSNMGFRYKDIVEYYYSDTYIVSIEALEFFKTDTIQVDSVIIDQ